MAPPPLELTTPVIVGLEVVILGLVLAAGSRLTAAGSRARRGLLLVGVVALGVGGALTAGALRAELAAPARQRNPLPATPEVVERGRVLFQQNCLPCHGASGRGDGPLAGSLPSLPANLRTRVPERPEGLLFARVSDGMPGTPMPAFADRLSAEDRWRIVAFIRGFDPDAPPAARTAVAELAAID
jgi:putative copper resistance protein D